MLVLQSLIFGLFVALIAFYVTFRWNRRRLYELASKFPGPKGLPFIGVGHRAAFADFKSILNFFLTVPDGFGDEPVGAWLGPEFLIFANTPEIIKVVLNSEKCLDKTSLYERATGVFYGVALIGGNMWKKHRKILNPSFNLNVLQKLVPTFDEKSKILVKNTKTMAGKEQFNIYHHISACSLETILKSTMEIDQDIQSNFKENLLLHHMDEILELIMTKGLNCLYYFYPIYRLSKLYAKEKKCREALKFGEEIYSERAATAESFRADDEYDDGYARKPKSFIKCLLNPANCFIPKEIIDEINNMAMIGHETSAHTLSNTLVLVAMHPEVQRKLVEELKEVFGSADGSIDVDQLNKLTYMDMVLRESMRILPVLAFVGRTASEEFNIGSYTIPKGANLMRSYTIPKGANIIISMMKVQRNKKYWGDDADQFRPERFEPESIAKVHPYAYIPFTGGPRICIGYRYAMLFMKTVLSNFLMNYEVATTMKYDEIELELPFVLKIVQGYIISLKERQF